MPVIIVGADTPIGRDIVDGMRANGSEIRAFVTDLGAADALRRTGVHVAIGDVSDSSHVELACTSVHTAVLISEASSDTRERSFAVGWEQVLDGWLAAVGDAEVVRVIWVLGAHHRAWAGFEGRTGHDAVRVGAHAAAAGVVAEVLRIDDLPDS